LLKKKRPNTLCHIDFTFENAERCQKFYEKCFGWKFTKWQDHYFLFSTPDAFHTLQGGFVKKTNDTKMGNSCIVYLEVLDIKSAVDLIASNGAKNISKVENVGSFGLSATFDDTEGNRVALWQTL